MNRQLDTVIGYTNVELDATFTTVRSKESNMGNFVADIMRGWYDADVALVVGGTLRSDVLFPPGPIRMKDIVLTFPFEDPCVVLSVTGKEILDALENGVSSLPALEGRFLQVSGCKYKYCLEKTPRIQSVEIAGVPLDPTKMYICATQGYIMHGKDGFASLMVPPDRQIVNIEEGLVLVHMLQMWFLSVKLSGEWHQQAQKLPHLETSSDTAGWRDKLKNGGAKMHRHHKVVSVDERDVIVQARDLLVDQKVLEVWQNGTTMILKTNQDITASGISPQVEGRISRVDSHGKVIEPEIHTS